MSSIERSWQDKGLTGLCIRAIGRARRLFAVRTAGSKRPQSRPELGGQRIVSRSIASLKLFAQPR
jgi:hypothetical protein